MNKAHSAIATMISQYQCESLSDYTNALKEIIQQITLLGLWRAKFFEKAAFYGGTALRILYQLDRFSEDMDFSLLKPNLNFDLKKYNEAIEAELQAFGFETNIEIKEKIKASTIKSALIKTETRQQLITLSTPIDIIAPLHKQQKIKIKMEIDINPPLNFETESKILLNPIPFSVITFQKPDLFASKIHAILCRNWRFRVKGRDWYDLVWYVTQNIPLRLSHLKTRLEHNGYWSSEKSLQDKELKELLNHQILKLDIKKAKEDVAPFINDRESIDLWSKDFFFELVEKIKII